MTKRFRPGVLHGQEVTDLLNYANEHDFALPAVNVIGTNTVNAVLETAAAVNSPVIIQFSHGGSAFFAGKGLSNEGQKASIVGGISGAQHVHAVAEAYGVPVILHTDHCALNIIDWVGGLLDEGERFYEKNGYPLYSSHMLDLSEEPLHENVEICAKYLARMKEMGMTLGNRTRCHGWRRGRGGQLRCGFIAPLHTAERSRLCLRTPDCD
jgi:fructose-bisphosphate aldolase, class II